MTENGVPVMIPLREASLRTGLSYDRLRKLCLAGKIVHYRTGKKFLVNFGRLLEFLDGGGESE